MATHTVAARRRQAAEMMIMFDISHVHFTTSVTHRHVRPAACIPGFSDGVHQLTADAEVAQLYVAVPVQEDV